MPSYIFRGIDAPLWDQVKLRVSGSAALLELVQQLLRGWLAGAGNLQAEVERAQIRQTWAWEHAAEVYKERDLLVRALSMQFPSHLMYRKGHQPAVKKKLMVCIHGPTGQMAWTVTPEMREYFRHLEITDNDWDNHKTAERNARLTELNADIAREAAIARWAKKGKP